MSSDQTPAWYDETKVTKATFADGYSGWVVDLGDGTCRFSNSPLLGEGGPEWGDRVDLFYNPCDPFERPRVGYRIYRDGEEPVGRHFGLKKKPSKKEIKEHEAQEKRREQAEVEMIERNFDSMFGRLGSWKEGFEKSNWIIRYFELAAFIKEKGVEVPDDLHEPKKSWEEEEEEARGTCESRRKELKTMMLAALQAQFSDVEVSDDEVREMAESYTETTKQGEILKEKFAEQIASMTLDEEDDIDDE